MKLSDWSLDFFRLPYDRRVVWANAIEDAGTFALLRLVADDGSVGIAEGTIKATWSGVSPRMVRAAFEDLFLPALRSVDLSDPAVVAAAWAGIPENRLVKQLIDNASWSLVAASARRPLWAIWEGAREVDLTWAVTRQPPRDMAADAAVMCERYGFRTLKVKGGQGVETDLQALEAIRRAVGPAVELVVDANSAYTRDEALDYVQRLAGAGVTVAEDPCALIADAAFAALQAASPLPILVDASCTSLADATMYLDRGAQALMTKPGRIGFSEARAIGAACAARGARVAVGLYAETALGTMLSSQLAAAIPASERVATAEQTFFLIMRDQVTTSPPMVRDGRLRLPDDSSFDSLVDWDKVRHYALA